MHGSRRGATRLAARRHVAGRSAGKLPVKRAPGLAALERARPYQHRAPVAQQMAVGHDRATGRWTRPAASPVGPRGLPIEKRGRSTPLFLIPTAQHMGMYSAPDPWLGAAAMVAAGAGWGLVLAVLAA
jgi:hypothetical protein